MRFCCAQGKEFHAFVYFNHVINFLYVAIFSVLLVHAPFHQVSSDIMEKSDESNFWNCTLIVFLLLSLFLCIFNSTLDCATEIDVAHT